jgi:hypothetical protein
MTLYLDDLSLNRGIKTGDGSAILKIAGNIDDRGT